MEPGFASDLLPAFPASPPPPKAFLFTGSENGAADVADASNFALNAPIEIGGGDVAAADDADAVVTDGSFGAGAFRFINGVVGAEEGDLPSSFALIALNPDGPPPPPPPVTSGGAVPDLESSVLLFALTPGPRP